MHDNNTKKISWKQKLSRGFKEYWINVLYLTIFFSIFTDYRRLILAHYNIYYGNYGVSVINALILGKVILIVEHLPFGKGFEDRPLIIPTLYKSSIFTICVAIFIALESMAHRFFIAKSMAGVSGVPARHSVYEWTAGALMVFCAFVPFFAMRELSHVLGEGVIPELFFRRKRR